MALYQSRYADHQIFIRAESVIYHPATGVEIGRTKRLIANFGHHAGEFMMEDPLTGQPERHALIYGHFFDTNVAAEQNGWTPDEKESVEYTLDRLAKQQPFLLARIEHEQPVFAPDKPWPTYDEAHWRQIAPLAETLGLLNEALSYEQNNRNRDPVIDAINSKLSPSQETDEVEIAL